MRVRENERESARLHFPPRILNERGKVRGKERGRRPPAPGILRGGALLQQSSRAHSPIPWLQPLLLQSICNSASSSSSPTNPGGFPQLPHPGAPGSSPACPPLPPCRHPFLELHHRDTGTSASPLPSLCSVAFVYGQSARLRIYLYLELVLCSAVHVRLACALLLLMLE